MNVTVALPTYRRPESLPWALASILLQRHEGARQVVVINNGGEEGSVEAAVEQAVRAFGDHGWRIRVIHRRPAMEPVTSWYTGIFDHASEGDAVFLHGDDDLLPPGSLQARCLALESSCADMLLTRSTGGLFFDVRRAGTVLVTGQAKVRSTAQLPGRVVALQEVPAWDPGFIGNHTYRLGEVLQRAFGAACRQAQALPIDTRTAMTVVPFLLPIPVADAGAVAGSDLVGCIRGQSLQTITEARFGHTTWSPGIIYAASLRALSTGLLGERVELDPWRKLVGRDLAGWYVPTASVARTRAQLGALGFLGPSSHLRNDLPAVLRGARLTAASLLGVQGLRFRWDRLAQRSGFSRVLVHDFVSDLFGLPGAAH